MLRTLAFGIYDHNLVCAREALASRPPQRAAVGGVLRERLWKIRARAVIAATGAFERPMIFPDNDRPGVMLAGAADKYAHAFGVACGRRVVIAANSDSAYGVAASLRGAGRERVARRSPVDRRPRADIGAALSQLRIFMNRRHRARRRRAACAAARSFQPTSIGARPERLDCDLILSAGGYAPAVHLHSQAGGKLRWVDESAMFVPDGAAPGVWSAGACAGIFARDAAVHARRSRRGTARAAQPRRRRRLAAPADRSRGRRDMAGAARASSSSTCKTMWPSATSAWPRKRTIARSSI